MVDHAKLFSYHANALEARAHTVAQGAQYVKTDTISFNVFVAQ